MLWPFTQTLLQVLRLFEPIGSIPPAELEKAYYTDLHSLPVAAGLT